jgi:RNA polymerase sigma factor (sigma-70 family)
MNKLILDYIPLANSIAIRKKKNLPKYVTLDELKSAAYLGLTQAANKFNPELGSFYGYAHIRINGAIKDHLRSLLDYGKDNIIDDVIFVEKDNLQTNDFFDVVSKKLSKSESKIIRMYYIESKTMKEIGELESISESRVSQIISSSHKKLKRTLKRV